jgi:DNA-binding winged helix-turn-helix (wHTH) protein
MTSGPYRFEGFVLDPADRRLTRRGESVELNARYLDALVLLVAEEGRLVTKDRFMSEVWRGVPVTDEALTQCIRTLRRTLDDSATRPRFIETVTGHGYRFVAKVETGSEGRPQPPLSEVRSGLHDGLAGLFGGGAAGAFGGLVYGFVAAQAQATGAASVLVVILCLTVIMALTGGAGVGFGIAVARRLWDGPVAMVAGAALGGMATGAVVKLVGLDAFNLLFGRAPVAMTGAGEGAILGAATGLGVWLGLRGSLRRGMVLAGLSGTLGGGLIALAGGRLMLGSLVLLGDFPGSHLRLAVSPVWVAVSATLEGGLFAACVVVAMRWGRSGRLWPKQETPPPHLVA